MQQSPAQAMPAQHASAAHVPPPGRVHKAPRGGISDQQRRREAALKRQVAARRNLQQHARQLALDAVVDFAGLGEESDVERRLRSGEGEPNRGGEERGLGLGLSGGEGQRGFIGGRVRVQEVSDSAGSEADSGAGVAFVELDGGGERDGDNVSANEERDATNLDAESGERGREPCRQGEVPRSNPPGDRTLGKRSQSLKISEWDEGTGTWHRIDREGRDVEGGEKGGTNLGGHSKVGTSGGADEMVVEAEGGAEGGKMEEGEEEGMREEEHMMASMRRDFLSHGIFEGRKEDSRSFFAQQLMLPEWMVDVPPRLQSEWFVLPRPDGRRCLVVASNGCTVSRLRNGRVLHRFPSCLPNGARTKGVAAAPNVYCILDCVFYEPTATYYILDVMAWRGYCFYDCPTDFRFFWMRSNLPDSPALLSLPGPLHRFRFALIPSQECSLAGLRAAYEGQTEFTRDGLLFYNRNAHYEFGLTPLVLQWKDQQSSRFVVDTDQNGNIPPQQIVVLEFQADGSVCTSDSPPVVLATLPAAFVRSNAKYLRKGTLLKFAVGPKGVLAKDGQPVVVDLHYLGPGNQRRGGADSISKILFQHAARNNPLSITDIILSIPTSGDDDSLGSSQKHIADEACENGMST